MMGIAVLALLASAAGQDTSTRWSAEATWSYERFTQARAPWHQATVTAGRRFSRGTLLAEGSYVRRFGLEDAAGALDAYYTFARRTYGNLRVQVAPGAEVIARADVAAEGFQGLGHGFEASAGWRHMAFSDLAVNVGSLGLGRYTGSWYLRARAAATWRPGATGSSGTVMIRRYGATADDLLEVQGGVGRDVVTVRAQPLDVELRATTFLAARLRRRIHGALGGTIGASWNREEGIPTRYGLAAGLFTRW